MGSPFDENQRQFCIPSDQRQFLLLFPMANECRCFRIFQQIGQLGLLVHRVDLDENAAQALNGIVGDDILQTIGQHHCDPVAFAQPQTIQDGSKPIHDPL